MLSTQSLADFNGTKLNCSLDYDSVVRTEGWKALNKSMFAEVRDSAFLFSENKGTTCLLIYFFINKANLRIWPTDHVRDFHFFGY